MGEKENSDFRTVRGYQIVNRREGQLTPAQEDYLEMSYRLYKTNDYVRIGRLSELLNVKPPSASKMISRLAGLGYVKYDRYEIIQLTESGLRAGEYLLKRHKTIETFLRLIGSANALEETELIEHTLSVPTVSELDVFNRFMLDNAEILEKYQTYKKKRGDICTSQKIQPTENL